MQGPICSVPGCTRPHSAKGLCNAHYMRARRNRPMEQPIQLRSITTKNGAPMQFINDVALSYDKDDCLIWPFGRGRGGYALIAISQGTVRVASRYICELAHGPAPGDDFEAAFKCHNGHSGCVNPRHLVWRSQEENISLRKSEGRAAKGPKMPHAKLDERKVREIRRSYPSTSAPELAKIYGVAETTIFNVIKRKKWAWVT